MPTAEDFREQLLEVFRIAAQQGISPVIVNAGDLHRLVGDYPGTNHRMPVCCEVMRNEMRRGDVVVDEPPKGQGATLTIRYFMPRAGHDVLRK
jgi:5-methylcytosine-specific restriction protein A